MPFGLKSSPTSFTRLINTVFHGMLGENLFAYMDDLIIASRDIREHLEIIQNVFTRLRESNLKVKLRKCEFLKKEIIYLGHKIGEQGVEITLEKVAAVQNFPAPTTKKNIMQFIGLAGFYRKFIKNFSAIAAPITDLLKKDRKFEWGEEQDIAFKALKDALTSPPILTFPDFNEQFYVVTDASNLGVGGALMQIRENKLKPIAYYSRKLRSTSPNEHILSVTDKEALAVINSLMNFKFIIFGHEITVLTDHLPLVDLFNKPSFSPRRARWQLILQEFNVKIRYIKGKDNVIADALSRNICTISKENGWDDKYFAKKQDEDELLFRAKNYLRDGTSDTMAYKLPLDNLELRDNLLVRSTNTNTRANPNNNRTQVIVPRALIEEVLRWTHDSKFSTHPGKERTYLQTTAFR